MPARRAMRSIWTLADVTAQFIERRVGRAAGHGDGAGSSGADNGRQRSTAPDVDAAANWDRWRTARMAIVGFTMSGPLTHFWYALLDKCIPGRPTARRVAVKVLLDQFAFAPALVSAYFVALTYMEGGNADRAVAKIRRPVRCGTGRAATTDARRARTVTCGRPFVQGWSFGRLRTSSSLAPCHSTTALLRPALSATVGTPS